MYQGVFWYVDSSGKVEIDPEHVGIPDDMQYGSNDWIVYTDQNEDILEVVPKKNINRTKGSSGP